MRLFPSGYAGVEITIAVMRLRADVRALDPEMRRRVFRLMRHLARLGIPYGIGGGGRTRQQQIDGFYLRHYLDPSGPIYWNGQRWRRKTGYASWAKPDESYHQETPPYGALAIDAVPPDSWDEANYIVSLFGLVHFTHVNGEPWHLQPIEVPRGRSVYNANPGAYKLQRYRPPKSKKPGPEFPPFPKRAAA